MIRFLPVIALLALNVSVPARAEPQGGFPSQRDRATHAPTQAQPRNTMGQKDEVERRQEEVSRRDKAVTRSICKGC